MSGMMDERNGGAPARYRRIAGAAGAALILLWGLAACAPEPVAGQGGKDADPSQGESSWSDPVEDFDAEQRQTELPADFPSAEFPLPEGVTIYDTGARDASAWFLVLSAADAAAAETLWGEVLGLGGFTPEEETATAEGGVAATLTNATLRVLAVTIPQEDGTVLLSYDISRPAA